MYDLNGFFQRLDWFYENHRLEHAENFMREQLGQAQELGEDGAALAILNELMGFLRTQGRFEECLKRTDEALALAGRMGLDKTVPGATTLLNAATCCRAAGALEPTREYYERTLAIYQRELPPDDYRVASLYNNLSILKSDMGLPGEALDCLLKALSIVEKKAEFKAETAITHTNMGMLYSQLGDFQAALSSFHRALAIFGDGLEEDPHYGAALAGLGEALYKTGDLPAAEDAYGRALAQIKKCYGENESWRVTGRNLERVRREMAAGNRERERTDQ